MGYRSKGEEGVLAKSQILISNQFGTLLDRRGVSKVHVPKFDLFRVFSPSFLKFLLPKPLILLFLQTEQSTIETAHINFMIKRGIYSLICVSWICNKKFWKLRNLPKVPKNHPKMSQMQVGGRGSLVKPTCSDFGCP